MEALVADLTAAAAKEPDLGVKGVEGLRASTGSADVHARDDAALQAACSGGHLLVVERLLAVGADVHARDDAALHAACSGGHLLVVERLLAAGANVHADHDQALRCAVQHGHLAVVQRLLAAGADVHVNDDQPLSLAIDTRNERLVACLVAAGADVHSDDDYVLRWASWSGHLNLVEHLLAAGANVHANNDQALRWASGWGETAVVARLLAAGANSDRMDWRPFMHQPQYLIESIPRRGFSSLPTALQPLWLRYHVRYRTRLQRLLRLARERLGRPAAPGPQAPEALAAAHLQSNGTSVASEDGAEVLQRIVPRRTAALLAPVAANAELAAPSTNGGRRSTVPAVPVSTTDGAAATGGDRARRSACQLRVLDLLDHSTAQAGEYVGDLARRLGLPLSEIRTAVDGLEDDGYIYSTCDEHHWLNFQC